MSGAELAGKKALIVDDDIRNIFALTGALEQQGITVINAENGKDGIEMLKENPDIDIVLMDIMMPELDGYDTIRIIRGLDEFKNLPIIAITAKAMKGDREKCIEAGASDYIAKPVNMEQLMSLLRVWLDAVDAAIAHWSGDDAERSTKANILVVGRRGAQPPGAAGAARQARTATSWPWRPARRRCGRS